MTPLGKFHLFHLIFFYFVSCLEVFLILIFNETYLHKKKLRFYFMVNCPHHRDTLLIFLCSLDPRTIYSS